jgi:hypothetical protein
MVSRTRTLCPARAATSAGGAPEASHSDNAAHRASALSESQCRGRADAMVGTVTIAVWTVIEASAITPPFRTAAS